MSERWLGIDSSNYDSHCGDDDEHTIEEALNGTDYWHHQENHTHWFVVDLGQTYPILKVRGRSHTTIDPSFVNIYIDDSNPPTTLVSGGIITWQDTDTWVEINTPNSNGRYIKVEIESTESLQDYMGFGKTPSPYITIFDACVKVCNKDLKIYYNTLTGWDFICCDCSRWDTNDYNITVETWLTKTQLQTLRNNITPGAAGELYQILGQPTFYDQTWAGENTLKLSPNTSDSSTLSDMRGEKVVYVKNINDTPIKGPSGFLNVKLECMISGTQSL